MNGHVRAVVKFVMTSPRFRGVIPCRQDHETVDTMDFFMSAIPERMAPDNALHTTEAPINGRRTTRKAGRTCMSHRAGHLPVHVMGKWLGW